MPVVVNKNPTATLASFNLSRANDMLRHSLAKLSSGKRIINASDDAGGLAVAYKMESALKRTEAVRINVQNGLSYLQVQDGALSSVGKILDRMAELRTMAQDVTKNSGDIENYSKEFIELQSQLKQIKNDTFNGISLFASGTTSVTNDPSMNKSSQVLAASVNGTAIGTFDRYGRTMYTHPSGQTNDGSISLNVVNLEYVLEVGTLDGANSVYWGGTTANAGQGVNLGDVESNQTAGAAGSENGINAAGFIQSIMGVSMGQLTAAIERLADARAESGAEMSRLNMVNELLIQNQTNLEAAYGRIMDADVALESTRFARHNVLVQASAAMLSQANSTTSTALMLLG